MAQIDERLPQNVPGDFFVDASCIDCDACRQIAPASFREYGGKSVVYRQPQNPGEVHRALMALAATPFELTPIWKSFQPRDTRAATKSCFIATKCSLRGTLWLGGLDAKR